MAPIPSPSLKLLEYINMEIVLIWSLTTSYFLWSPPSNIGFQTFYDVNNPAGRPAFLKVQ